MKLSAEEYMDLCKRCWHSYIAFPDADFELAYANNVSPLDACTAIWSVHRKELSLTDPEAAPTQGADALSDNAIINIASKQYWHNVKEIRDWDLITFARAILAASAQKVES